MPSHKVSDKLLAWGSDIEPGTIQQAERTSRLPIVEDYVALMPDAHFGIGSTVGSVIPTKGAVIPAAVGVDIGCGMIAVETTLSASDLPDTLDPLMPIIEEGIPAGVAKGHTRTSDYTLAWLAKNPPPNTFTPKQEKAAVNQLGSLGSGNHFFEVCLDERDTVWLVLHSGSRGIGNQLAQVHIGRARANAKAWQIPLEDPDLAYFVQGKEGFQDYINDMHWSQDYARANREFMMNAAIKAVARFMGGEGSDGAMHWLEESRINCHHNFTQMERHHGKKLWITRKGAIKADIGDFGVIPGSMGTRSYIIRGKGNPASYNSCAHGAGRRMSRGDARRRFTAEDLQERMEGRVWNNKNAKSLIDEIPDSYKSIDQVMEDQDDLVQVLHTLHQILNFKGS